MCSIIFITVVISNLGPEGFDQRVLTIYEMRDTFVNPTMESSFRVQKETLIKLAKGSIIIYTVI